MTPATLELLGVARADKDDRVERKETAMATEATQHPYGAGSHAPLENMREMPTCYPIKGTIDSMLYHRPDSENYGPTIADVWFDSPSIAEAAGFVLAPTHSTEGVSADYEPGGSGHPCAQPAVHANRSAVIGRTALATSGSTTVDGDASGRTGDVVRNLPAAATGAGLTGRWKTWWWLFVLILGILLVAWVLIW